MHLATNPLCRSCEDRGLTIRAYAVDHVIPHRGDPVLFWDAENLQSLCKRCHDAGKQKAERAGFTATPDASGWPVDPAHPANRAGRGRVNL